MFKLVLPCLALKLLQMRSEQCALCGSLPPGRRRDPYDSNWSPVNWAWVFFPPTLGNRTNRKQLAVGTVLSPTYELQSSVLSNPFKWSFTRLHSFLVSTQLKAQGRPSGDVWNFCTAASCPTLCLRTPGPPSPAPQPGPPALLSALPPSPVFSLALLPCPAPLPCLSSFPSPTPASQPCLPSLALFPSPAP